IHLVLVFFAEKLHWPEQESTNKSLLNPGEKLIIDCENNISHLASGILKDIFTTGTSSYNVLLQSKEEKKSQLHKPSSPAHHRRHRKPSRSPGSPRGKEQHPHKIKVPMPLTNSSWCYLNKQPSIFVSNPLPGHVRFSSSFSVSGSSLTPKPKPRAKGHSSGPASPLTAESGSQSTSPHKILGKQGLCLPICSLSMAGKFRRGGGCGRFVVSLVSVSLPSRPGPREGGGN
uniref:Uncharacterized protein n=1 Tax=Vombatus ursinus TaxID=29139 RepID=A0A4X2LKR6_VOMUR